LIFLEEALAAALDAILQQRERDDGGRADGGGEKGERRRQKADGGDGERERRDCTGAVLASMARQSFFRKNMCLDVLHVLLSDTARYVL
jgi:hypothetical protein